MRQVGIEPVTKTKFRIYLDGQFAFVLYKSELSSCHLKDGEAVTEDQIETILSEIVLKRAKRKAMSLLQSMDRTESELRDRLLRQDFPEETVDQAVRYVKSFGYVDDRRYAESFILSRKGRKSRREIYAELSGKKIGLFGSYGWGDGEWMRNWEETCRGDGAQLVMDGVIRNEAPDRDAENDCKNLGKALA